MKLFATTTIVTLCMACASSVPGSQASTSSYAPELAEARHEIDLMMSHSAASWNRGDLAAFVGDYTTDATFITHKGLVRGTEAIRGVYQSRFEPGAIRDSLSFELADLDLLAPGVANVVAYYKLSRGDSTVAKGPTSLVMRRTDGKWQILHDHSS